MEENMRIRLANIGTKILTSSRNELYLSMRFLDIALSNLEYKSYLSTLSIGTDGESILYHPKYLMDLYAIDPVLVNRVYLHMVLHCLFRHMYLREDREEELWNIACDIAVESIIDSMEYKSVHRIVSDQRTEVYEWLKEELPVFTAEGIYRALKKRLLPLMELEAYRREFCKDDHDIWEAKREEKPKSQDGPENQNDEDNKDNQEQSNSPQSDILKKEEQHEQWKKTAQKMETNLETISKEYGEEAGDFLKRLKVETRERQDYKQFLRKFSVMKEELQVDEESFDYAFYTYGLQLYKNMPLIEPLEYKEVNRIEEFVIAIDTSGSCSGKLIQSFLEETYGILRDTNTFSKKVRIYIIQCDAKIQEVAEITSEEELIAYMENYQVRGFGGTDFRPVFDYVNQLIGNGSLKRLKGMLYFTDGYGTFPKQCPKYEVAFVFMRDDYSDTNVPPWAMKITIEPEQLEKKEPRG